MKRIAVVALVAALPIAACGEDDPVEPDDENVETPVDDPVNSGIENEVESEDNLGFDEEDS